MLLLDGVRRATSMMSRIIGGHGLAQERPRRAALENRLCDSGHDCSLEENE